MALANFTVTAKAGPAIQATAISISGVQSYFVDARKLVLQLYNTSDQTGPAREFDLTGVTTFTTSISGGVFTIVIS